MNKFIDSLYIHFPFCKHLCNYCDFFKSVPENKDNEVRQFQAFLTQSYQTWLPLMQKYQYQWTPLQTLYIGGGTPSLWGIQGANYLKNFFTEHGITLSSNCEFTLEVNPGAWTEDIIEKWINLGVNRFSIGIQTLSDRLLPLLDRTHTLDESYKALEFFHKHKLNYSIDFMLGLPHSELHNRSILDELKETQKFSPGHYSVYILTVKENFKYFSHLPTEHWIEDEYLKTATFLTENNFNHYEVSNFAQNGKESIHNLNYWKSKSVAALGPSATGFFQEERLRYKWQTLKPEFQLEHLSQNQYNLEETYMSLRSSLVGLPIPKEKLTSSLSKRIELWKKNGWCSFHNQKITLTSKGYLILDSLINELFLEKFI